MKKLTIVFWRDIPAQLLIGSGRKATKYKLAEKYEKAIDRCAMKVGAKDSESYLRDWRKKSYSISGDGTKVIEEEAARLELKYSDLKLKELVENDGWNKID